MPLIPSFEKPGGDGAGLNLLVQGANALDAGSDGYRENPYLQGLGQ
jgi:hypothetical protein